MDATETLPRPADFPPVTRVRNGDADDEHDDDDDDEGEENGEFHGGGGNPPLNNNNNTEEDLLRMYQLMERWIPELTDNLRDFLYGFEFRPIPPPAPVAQNLDNGDCPLCGISLNEETPPSSSFALHWIPEGWRRKLIPWTVEEIFELPCGHRYHSRCLLCDPRFGCPSHACRQAWRYEPPKLLVDHLCFWLDACYALGVLTKLGCASLRWLMIPRLMRGSEAIDVFRLSDCLIHNGFRGMAFSLSAGWLGRCYWMLMMLSCVHPRDALHIALLDAMISWAADWSHCHLQQLMQSPWFSRVRRKRSFHRPVVVHICGGALGLCLAFNPLIRGLLLNRGWWFTGLKTLMHAPSIMMMKMINNCQSFNNSQ